MLPRLLECDALITLPAIFTIINTGPATMRRLDLSMVTAQQTRRAANAGGGVIRASVPNGLGGAIRPHCSAVAGMALELPTV